MEIRIIKHKEFIFIQVAYHSLQQNSEYVFLGQELYLLGLDIGKDVPIQFYDSDSQHLQFSI